MVIQTKDLGTIEIDEKNLINMVEPIYGFEHLKKFVLLSDTELGEEIKWLQSVEDSQVCFVLVDPRVVMEDYNPPIPKQILEKLQATRDGVLVWAIAVIPEEFRNSTINLKSPVVVNPKNHFAVQVILEQPYPIKTPLIPQEGGSI